MKTKSYSVESILANLKIDSLNEMQQASLAANEKNNDVILLSATGSGKTLAFLLPLLNTLDLDKKQTQAMIIVPSRELAQQIEQVFKSMGTGIKITCCYGGHEREIEKKSLQQNPVVVVGTPGRLADHIRRGDLSLSSVACLVLDEFDKALELGFQEEMSFIIDALPALKKKILTSATEAVEVPEFVGLEKPEKLHFLSSESDQPERLSIKKVMSADKDKLETLFKLLCFLGNQASIVFCNHRESVERTSKFLLEKGLFNEFYHGAIEQRDRERVLFKFRNGSVNILVTTDLASRGLDIPHIQHIIHYHLPPTQEVFTHRNGRTARMDASGTAIVILSPEEKLPSYVDAEPELLPVPEKATLPEKPQWATLYVAAGKKDKINKVDIVGFLSNKGKLNKDDIGLIEVKDFFSFVAVRKSKLNSMMHLIKGEKLKNKKILIEAAR